MFTRLLRFFHPLFAWITIGKVGIMLLLLAVPGGVLNYFLSHPGSANWFGLVEDFYANLSWELTGIAVTILIIDRLYQRAEDQRTQSQLLRQLHSHDDTIVLQAIDLLRINGWLDDGILVNVNLERANLGGANLRHADLRYAALRGADLHRVDLRDADLRSADFQDANLTGAQLDGAQLNGANLTRTRLAGASLRQVTGLTADQLRRAECMVGAQLREGRRYDGRFDLPGDESAARLAGYHLSDPTAMARFYQVTLADYLAGRDDADDTFHAEQNMG